MENFDLEDELYNRYRDELQLAYKSCMHLGQFYAGEFNDHINSIWLSAKDDGMIESDYQDIIDEVANQHVDSIIYPFPTLVTLAA